MPVFDVVKKEKRKGRSSEGRYSSDGLKWRREHLQPKEVSQSTLPLQGRGLKSLTQQNSKLLSPSICYTSLFFLFLNESAHCGYPVPPYSIIVNGGVWGADHFSF